MGRFWFCCCAWLVAPLIVCASDSDVLAELDEIYDQQSTILAELQGLSTDVGYIESSVAYLSEIKAEMGYHYPHNNGRTLATDLDSLYNVLDSIQLAVIGSYNQQRHLFIVNDETLESDVEAFRDDVRSYSRQITNVINKTNSKLDTIVDHIDYLTNFLGKSQTIPLQPDLMTNLIFLTMWANTTVPLSYGTDQYPYNSNIKALYRVMFGRDPSSSELNRFRGIAQFSPSRGVYYDIFSSLDPSEYLDYSTQFTPNVATLRNYFASSASGEIAVLAKNRYHQYATLPLLKLFQSYTNDYPISTAVSTTIENGRPSSSFTSGFVGAVESLSTSFIPNVNTNIATVATNAIVNRADNSYVTKYEELQRETPDDTGLSEMLSSITEPTSFVDDFASEFQSHNSQVTLSFNLPQGVRSDTQHVELVLSDVAKTKLGYIFVFLFRLIRICIFVVVAVKCYDLVISSQGERGFGGT